MLQIRNLHFLAKIQNGGNGLTYILRYIRDRWQEAAPIDTRAAPKLGKNGGADADLHAWNRGTDSQQWIGDLAQQSIKMCRPTRGKYLSKREETQESRLGIFGWDN
jgi:hypothetical protein